MRYLNAVMGITLVGLAVMGLLQDGSRLWPTAFLLGAVLAFMSAYRGTSIWTTRALAGIATLTMFIFFAGFFLRAPMLDGDWYVLEGASRILSLLLAAFCMMPVVAEFSCQMKSASAGVTR